MMRGVIASLRTLQGFGFITTDSRRYKVYFHHSTVEGGRFSQLREGQDVEFADSADPLDPRRTRADTVLPCES